jgi:hypothetical protein
MSICMARAPPSLGRNSDHGKPVPTIRRVSQPSIRSQLVGTQQADGAGDEGKIVGQHILSQQRLRDARSQPGSHLGQVRSRAAGASADQDSNLAASVQKFRRLCEVGLFGDDFRLAIANAGTSEPVRDGRLLIFLILDVLWKNEDGGPR